MFHIVDSALICFGERIVVLILIIFSFQVIQMRHISLLARHHLSIFLSCFFFDSDGLPSAAQPRIEISKKASSGLAGIQLFLYNFFRRLSDFLALSF